VALRRVTVAGIIAVVIDETRAQSTARTVAEAALGHDAGPMDRVDSKSHHVFVGAEAVVKLIAADDHARLDREITLGVDLPAGITAPVLAHGRIATEGGDIRYACMARQPGASPGMELVGVDRETALRWARQAAHRLQRLHDWSPGPAASAVLNEKLDHGGFVTRAEYMDLIERVGEASAVLSQATMDGLRGIADRAPERAGTTVPVHADCHWGNWLVHDDQVTVLLDFEWARFGEPVDDWMFLSRFSGSHMHAVLAVVAELTKTSLDSIRAACELRESSYLASDLLIAVSSGDHNEAQNIGLLLDRIIRERQWWES